MVCRRPARMRPPGVLGSASYRAPEFPVTRGHLRAQLLGEPFVEYFSTKWPHLVKG